MTNEIEKSEPSPDDVLTAITSFNDPAIIVNIFKDLGWTYSFEIREWLAMARQNANLSVKAKALIQLRKLLREAAETSGLIANVSQTVPNAQGGMTTFHAKRIAGMLNPTKQIKSIGKEIQNDEQKEIRTESNRGSDRGQSQTENPEKSINEQLRPRETSRADPCTSGTDTRRAFPSGDVDSGGIESPDGGETTRARRNKIPTRTDSEDNDSEESNPCVKTRPPTCDHVLFPGVSSAEG